MVFYKIAHSIQKTSKMITKQLLILDQAFHKIFVIFDIPLINIIGRK